LLVSWNHKLGEKQQLMKLAVKLAGGPLLA
jgi:hypothetical protein